MLKLSIEQISFRKTNKNGEQYSEITNVQTEIDNKEVVEFIGVFSQNLASQFREDAKNKNIPEKEKDVYIFDYRVNGRINHSIQANEEKLGDILPIDFFNDIKEFHIVNKSMFYDFTLKNMIKNKSEHIKNILNYNLEELLNKGESRVYITAH